MIISHAKEFVMFAPWKTASSTAHHRLRAYNSSPYSRFYHFNPRLGRVVHQHITCGDFLALPEAALPYARISIVRNPYDRVASGFIQLQRDIAQQPDAPFESPWVRALVLRQLADNQAQLARARFELNAWIATITEDQVREVGRNSSFPLHPACYWTHLGHEPYVDRILRTETFEADFAAFCAARNLEFRVENANVSDETVTNPLYRHVHKLDRSSISKINDLFADDFELLGYERL
jgi:hypothetical protein